MSTRQTTAPFSEAVRYSKSKPFFIALVIFLPALLLRFGGPLQFPMIYWDEGLWNLGPKHAVMLGDPFAFGWSHLYLSPMHYLTTQILYSVYSPSLLLSRWLAGLFGIGTIVFTYLIGKRSFGTRAGSIAAVLAAYNSLLIFSSRQAMLEPEVTFYMLGAIYFWFHPNQKLIWMSAICLSAALLVKIYSIALLPALLIGQILLIVNRSTSVVDWLGRISKQQWLTLGITSLTTALIYGLLYFSNPESFSKTWLVHSVERAENYILSETPTRFWDIVDMFRFTKQFLLHCPDLLILSLVGAAIAVKRRKIEVFFLLSWVIMTFLLVSSQAYRPVRYYYPILPALVWLAAYSLDVLFNARFIRSKLLLILTVAALCVFQMLRLLPFYHEGIANNRPMIAAAAWLNTNLKPGEPVLSMYQTALLIHHPVIPAPQYLDERWRAAQNPTLVLKLPSANYFFWTVFKTRRESAFATWASAYFHDNFEIVNKYGSFYTIWRKKEPSSVSSP